MTYAGKELWPLVAPKESMIAELGLIIAGGGVMNGSRNNSTSSSSSDEQGFLLPERE